MAAKKTRGTKSKTANAVTGPTTFAEPGVRRSFAHPDGRTYGLEVDGSRVYESWTLAKGSGQSNTSTRDDPESAHAFALAKVAELLKKGFVEGKPRAGRRYDRSADVVEVFHSDVDYEGERRSDFQPVPGRAHVYAHAGVSVAMWLVTSDDRRLAVLFQAVVWQSKMSEAARAAIADGILDFVVPRRESIFADRETPLRKLALDVPIGPFSHLVLLSPEVANVTVSRDVNVENVAIARSVYRVFPAHDCEVAGNESVTVAEARTSGRGAIPYGRWDREPHPVVDLAYLKKPGDTPKFLVFDPDEVDQRFSPAGFKRMKEAAVLLRNYKGEVKTLSRSDTPPSLPELRAFFGFAS